MGVNQQFGETPTMLELNLVVFTYPEESGCCPL